MSSPKDPALVRMQKVVRHVTALERLLAEAQTDSERKFITERLDALHQSAVAAGPF